MEAWKEPNNTAPVEPQEDPGFLEHVFQKQVNTFTTRIGTNPGDNYLSIIHAVDVIFKDEPVMQHYLVKCFPTHPGRRMFVEQANFFGKELFVYQDYFPQLERMVKESGADGKNISLGVPTFHGGNVVAAPNKTFENTPWSKENFLVMTDMRKSQDYRMAERMTGLDKDHAIIVLQEMARLHAISWAYKQKNGLKLLSSKYPQLIDDTFSQDELPGPIKFMMRKVSESTLKLTEESFGVDHPAHKNLKELLEVHYHKIMREFSNPEGIREDVIEDVFRVKPEEGQDYVKDPWLTAAHGDCWVNNMLFHYEEINGHPKPTHVIFVDFQLFKEACPTLDIAYFLSLSVRAPIRIQHKDEFLKTYHDAFISCCKELKVEPFPGFTLHNLKRRYKRSEIYGLMVALPILNIVLKSTESSNDNKEKSESKEKSGKLFSSVVENAGKNTMLNDEITATVLSMHENGVL